MRVIVLSGQAACAHGETPPIKVTAEVSMAWRRVTEKECDIVKLLDLRIMCLLMKVDEN
jgi:hypothetical protein